jgi:hypothetical protein
MLHMKIRRLPAPYVEGRKQGCGLPHRIVRLPFGLRETHARQRLRTAPRLDLSILIRSERRFFFRGHGDTSHDPGLFARFLLTNASPEPRTAFIGTYRTGSGISGARDMAMRIDGAELAIAIAERRETKGYHEGLGSR